MGDHKSQRGLSVVDDSLVSVWFESDSKFVSRPGFLWW